jgi:ankyrin repeat protein
MNEKGSLFKAIIDQDEARVKQLLNQGVDPNARCGGDRDGLTPLYYASLRGDGTSIMKCLIASKADVHFRPITNFNGTTISLLRCCIGLDGRRNDAKINLLLHHGIRLTKNDESSLANYSNDSHWSVPLHAYRIMGERNADSTARFKGVVDTRNGLVHSP